MSRGDGYDALYEVVGERIARARSATGRSQAKLALKVGVTRASIVNIEHGRQRAPLHLLWQIAAALEVEVTRLIPSPAELLARSAPVQLTPEILASIEHAAQDDPAAKRFLTDFIKKATLTIEGHDGDDQAAR